MSKKDYSSNGQNALSAYMSSLSKLKVLTPQQEKDLAISIAGQRFLYWKSIFSYPPFASAIADLVYEFISKQDIEKPSNDIFGKVHAASRCYRDRETKENMDAYNDACSSLSSMISKIDIDGHCCASIFSNLENIENKKPHSLNVKNPPKGSRKFSDYMNRVRKSKSDLFKSKENFSKANLRLVIAIARKYFCSMPMDDLIQEGNIGLMKAVDRFDPDKGYRFSTYASWWIRHCITRSIADKSRVVRLPAHVSADLQKINRAYREFEMMTGEIPNSDQISAATGICKRRLKNLESVYDSHISIDAYKEDHDNQDILDWVHYQNQESENNYEPERAILFNESQTMLYSELGILSPTELDILESRYGFKDEEPHTLRTVADRHSLSRERIRQIQNLAIAKLKRKFAKIV